MCKTVFNSIQGEAPTYLSDLFPRLSNVHSHNTRNALNYGILVPQARTKAGKKAFSHHGACLWNQLPNDVKNSTSQSSFTTSYWRYRYVHLSGWSINLLFTCPFLILSYINIALPSPVIDDVSLPSCTQALHLLFYILFSSSSPSHFCFFLIFLSLYLSFSSS